MNELRPPPGGGGPPEGMLLGAVHVLDDVGPIRKSRPQLVDTALLLVPPVAVLLGLVAVPVGRTIGHGAAHLRPLPEGFGPALARTAAWAVLVPLGITIVGLVLADILGRYARKDRAPRLSGRVMFLLIAPLAVPLVVTGVAFRLLFQSDPERGFMTSYLGFIPGDKGWLGPQALTWSLVIAFCWAWVGLATVVLRTALTRMKDIIVRDDPDHGRVHIYPAEIEDALVRYGAIRQCALDVPTSRDRIQTAIIELEPGYEGSNDPDYKTDREEVVTPHKLRSYLDQFGGGVAHFQPEAYEFVSPLPSRTPGARQDPNSAPRFWQGIFYERYWSAGLGWVAVTVFLLISVMTSRTLDLILTMAPGSTLDNASVLSVLHWQQRESATRDQEALGTLWIVVVLLLALACLLVLKVTRCQRPRWPHLRFRGRESEAQEEDTSRRGVLRKLWRRLQRGSRQMISRLWTHKQRHPIYLVFAFLWLFPLIALLMTSLQNRAGAATTTWWEPESWWPPTKLSLESWTVDGGTFDAMLRTCGLALLTAVAVALLASFVAKALEGMSSLGEAAVLFPLIGLALVPPQVVGVQANAVFAWGEDTVSPWQRLLLIHVALMVPLAVMILYSTGSDWLGAMWEERQEGLHKIRDRETALRKAWIVVATPWKAMWTRQPTVAAVGVLVFVLVWNDFVIGVLVGQDVIPLTVHLSGQTRQFVSNSGPIAAGSVMAAVVPVILLLLTGSKLVEGLAGRDRNR